MSEMPVTKILDLFDRDVDRHIEEVIKVDQTTASVVKEEIEEYVATEQIRRYYVDVLEGYRETPNKPHEGIGVWISGFFGAGKSSFAKILGYVLENRPLNGTHAAALFAERAADPAIHALLKAINEQVPTKAIIFDVSTDQVVTDASEQLTDIVYRVLLRELGYATDREIAELEIELEGQDRLGKFEETFEEIFDGRKWDDVKHFTATARNHASRVLHELDSDLYPNADSWARTTTEVEVSANFVAKRAYELARRRADGRALVFIIDEVGQYVARSTQKMLDLQGLVQALGREGKNRAADWKGQVWLMVTSQERLSEVVDNLEGKQIELARLQDRFPVRVDLAPEDIREVTAERVLKKTVSADKQLRELYSNHKGKLQEGTRLTGPAVAPLDDRSFAQLYPFLPYHIDLLIKIVAGLRTQRGASKHVGGANRTIIKLAQQALIHEKTNLATEPVGFLVTLDMIYELQEGLIANERKQDIGEVERHFGADAVGTRVAKALCLLEFVKDVPRTAENLAAVLHPRVDAAPLRDEVEEALDELAAIHKARPTEEGWELLSKVGKNWEEERRGIEVFPKQRSSLIQEVAEQLFEELPGYRHENIKTFKFKPIINGQPLGRGGDIELHVQFVTETDAIESAEDRARQSSNTEGGQNSVHWVVPLLEQTVRAFDELHRSREMIRRYEPEKLSPEEARLLTDEKSRESSQRGRVGNLLRRRFRDGNSFLRGVGTELSKHGEELREQARSILHEAVPTLYPKFDLAAAKIGSKDAIAILSSDSMSSLPPAYGEGTGLGLVRVEGGKRTIASDHPALKEITEHIQQQKSYGEDVSGRNLENRFTGFGYGWDLEAVKLLTATLFRDTQIEVYRGKRYTSYADAGVREVFDKTQVFRGATFAPRKEGGVTLDELTACHAALEDRYGIQVNLEEGAIAGELRERMPREWLRADRALNRLAPAGLPGGEELQSLIEALKGVPQSSAEDTILAFHGQREQIAAGLARLDRLEPALGGENREMITRAQEAVDMLWPQLEAMDRGPDLADIVNALQQRLEDPDFFDHLPSIAQRSNDVRDAFAEVRANIRSKLLASLQDHEDQLRNHEEWEALEEPTQRQLLTDFERVRQRAESPTTALDELESHARGLDAILRGAVAELIRLTEPQESEDGKEPRVQRIRAANYAGGALRDENGVEEMLDRLGDACREAIARGEVVVLE